MFGSLVGLRGTGLILTILLIIAMWKIYQKFGEPGWTSLIPLYNIYILYKYTWGNGWYFLLLLIPFVNVVIQIITSIKLSKAFGHGGGFAVGLFFLPNIFYMILGFSEDRYYGYPLN